MTRRRRPRIAVTVQYGVKAPGLPTRREMARWARAALARDARVTVRVVGGAEGRHLNQGFRGKPHATNVLSFLMQRRPALEGDIALCAPVIRREARAQGKALAAHYAHLVVHGMLHLQGHDHATARQARAMERRETRILAALGFPDPWEQGNE